MTAIITGASRGLGRALATALAADGADVVVDARHAAGLRDLGPRIHGIPGDITDRRHRLALVDTARALGPIDVIVNNAGTLGPSPLPSLRSVDLDALTDVLVTNVVAQLGVIQAALPHLAPGAAIVNITSDAAVEGYEGWGAYGASKAALDQLTRVLAAEEPHLRVWSFDPGDLRTQMHQDAFPGEDISDRPDPETVVPAFRRLLALRPPSGRIRAADLVELAR